MPTTKVDINPDLKVLNATKIVQTALSAVMECYFAIRTSPLTTERIKVIKQKLNNMYVHFIALFQCNLRFCEDGRVCLPESRKIHAILCTMPPFLESMGCLDIADTASWESVHRVMTVALWDRTSKRICSMNAEMSIAAMLLNYRGTSDFLDAISFNNVDKYLEQVGPDYSPENVVIRYIQNKRNFQLCVNLMNKVLQSVDETFTLNDILVGTNFDDRTFTNIIKYNIGNANYSKLYRAIDPELLFIIPGISIEGNADSKAGKIYLYATNKFKGNKLRYDFVMVQNTDGLQPAQVMVFIMRQKNNDKIFEYYACVRYLTKAHERNQPHQMYNCPFDVYEWEYVDSRSLYPTYGIIKIETISGPAFITPVFSSDNTLPNSSKPVRGDKFWYVDRSYFDRAGWEDTIQTFNLEENIELGEYEIILPNNDVNGNVDLYDIDDNYSSDDSSDSSNREYDDADSDS